MHRWQQIEELFHAAVERPAPEREAYLREACASDPELYREVSVLASYVTDATLEESWAPAAAAQLIVGSQALTAGDCLGPYEIASFLAAGGMGVVYRARDLRMNREVAVKVCPDGFNERFWKEVRAAARLNHPNVCQLYDVGPNYLVMELVEGSTLAELTREGPLPLPKALGFGRQIADALDAAHRQDVIHCDLKPSNIKVTPNDVLKLLDFGLARQLRMEGVECIESSADDAALFGTTSYLSPELIENAPIDARADVFSFGLVLYEMLSGRPAFLEDTAASTKTAILRSEPAPLSVDARVAQLVRRCLMKKARERFQTMREVKSALDQIVAAMTHHEGSIAVLPFLDIGWDAENEYFSDGLTEEIINALSRVPELKVTARTSSFSFRGRHRDFRAIAETLGVQSVLQGSIRRAGGRVRVAVRLISAADVYHLWSETYDRELTDIFEVQDQIAVAVADALRIRLGKPPITRPRDPPRFAAYEAFLKGRHYMLKATPEALARARLAFEEAIALDARYPDPYCELGMHYVFMSMVGLGPGRELAPLIRTHAETALTVDEASPLAHALLGFVAATHDYDWVEAGHHFNVAIASPSVTGDARYLYSLLYLAPLGRAEAGVRQMEKALERDPLSVFLRTGLAGLSYLAGQFDRSRHANYEALEIDEAHWMPNFGEGLIALATGSLTDAVTAFEKAYRIAGWNVQIIGHLAGCLAATHDWKRADALVQQLLGGPPHSAPIGMAVYHSILLQADAAADWFARAIDYRDPLVLVYVRHPACLVMRKSSRWAALAKMLNLSGMLDAW
jgi:eukaryotic-like serine/threonine-protein kinase